MEKALAARSTQVLSSPREIMQVVRSNPLFVKVSSFQLRKERGKNKN
jgi:hypothetical protein